MNTRIIVTALLVVAFVRFSTEANEPRAVLLPPVDNSATDSGGKEKTEPPDKDKKPADKKSAEKEPAETPRTDLFGQGQGAAMGSQFPTGFNPQMMGDFGILFARQNVTFRGYQTITRQTTVLQVGEDSPPPIIPPPKTTTPVSQTRTLLVPYSASAGAFKVAENESPRPTDRVFGFDNYYGGIHGIGNNTISTFSPGTPQTVFDPFGNILSVKTDVRTVLTAPNISASLNTEVFGFEKTFLDGRASLEIRVPFLQANSNFNGFSGQNVGDITIVSKYAFVLDNQTGNVVSAGLAITAPTGPNADTIDGSLHSTLIQPWFGYIRNFDSFFIQGFQSIVVPTDSHDVTMLFTDIGLNYWLYRGSTDQLVSSIVPLCEVHVTTPLNHRNQDGPIFVPDQVVLTGGVHFGIMRNTIFSLGVATPVTNPRPYHIEGFAQLNWRF